MTRTVLDAVRAAETQLDVPAAERLDVASSEGPRVWLTVLSAPSRWPGLAPPWVRTAVTWLPWLPLLASVVAAGCWAGLIWAARQILPSP